MLTFEKALFPKAGPGVGVNPWAPPKADPVDGPKPEVAPYPNGFFVLVTLPLPLINPN